MNSKGFSGPRTLALAAILTLVAPQLLTAQECSCDNAGSSICSAQGFRITLQSFAVDGDAGTSSWNYQVCNEFGLDTDCEPPKDLSHIDIDLPALGACLTDDQTISLAQISHFSAVTLSCGVSEKDPSCDIEGTTGSDFVAKCDVIAPTNLDAGECVTMQLTIAGEQPTLGAGAATTVTKAGTECAGDCIRGPSCTPCDPGGGSGGACLTRTGGFWGTHPAITAAFLPVTVCGYELDTAAAGSCSSATEALCVAPGRVSKANQAYAQLIRQLTVAKLNLNATAANDGDCGPQITARIAACEALCGANHATISASGCIEDLTVFNESQDTFAITPPPFDSPGRADPGPCKSANRNTRVIGKGPCS